MSRRMIRQEINWPLYEKVVAAKAIEKMYKEQVLDAATLPPYTGSQDSLFKTHTH